MIPCPSCTQALTRVTDNLYKCDICKVFYPSHRGKLGYPLINPPPTEMAAIPMHQTPGIDTWHEFLRQWNLTNEQYSTMPQGLKDFYKYHYRMYLKELELRAQRAAQQEAMAKIIGMPMLRPRTALGLKKK